MTRLLLDHDGRGDPRRGGRSAARGRAARDPRAGRARRRGRRAAGRSCRSCSSGAMAEALDAFGDVAARRRRDRARAGGPGHAVAAPGLPAVARARATRRRPARRAAAGAGPAARRSASGDRIGRPGPRRRARSAGRGRRARATTPRSERPPIPRPVAWPATARLAVVPAAAVAPEDPDDAVVDGVLLWSTVPADRHRLRDRMRELRIAPWADAAGDGATLRMAAARAALVRLAGRDDRFRSSAGAGPRGRAAAASGRPCPPRRSRSPSSTSSAGPAPASTPWTMPDSSGRSGAIPDARERLAVDRRTSPTTCSPRSAAS